MSYCDDTIATDHDGTQTIFARVPARVMNEVIAAHGGLRHDSEALPPLVELDDGCEWAAAAEPPTTEESTESGTSEEGVTSVFLGPTSVMQLGAPPPPPPHTAPPTLGALAPPPELQTETLSPIVTRREENMNDSF